MESLQIDNIYPITIKTMRLKMVSIDCMSGHIHFVSMYYHLKLIVCIYI